MTLMVFGNVGRRHEHRALAQKLQLGDGACSGTRNYQSCGAVSQIHARYEGGGLHGVAERFGDGPAFVGIIFAGLPEHARSGVGPLFQGRRYALVDCAGAEAAADNENKLSLGVESKFAPGVGNADVGVGYVRPDGIARQYYLVGGEETLHPLVGGADSESFLRQQFVGDTGK